MNKKNNEKEKEGQKMKKNEKRAKHSFSTPFKIHIIYLLIAETLKNIKWKYIRIFVLYFKKK